MYRVYGKVYIVNANLLQRQHCFSVIFFRLFSLILIVFVIVNPYFESITAACNSSFGKVGDFSFKRDSREISGRDEMFASNFQIS